MKQNKNILLTFIMIFLLSISVTAITDANTIHYYNFETNTSLVDSLNQANGVVANTLLTTGTNGNGYLTNTGSSINATNFNYSTQGSLSFWFNQSTGGNQQLIDDNSADAINIQIFSGKIYAQVDGGSFAISNVFNLNEWNNVILTWNGTTYKVYLNNGVPVSINEAKTPTGSTRQLFIGQTKDSNSRFVGKIDELAIFNKVLNSSEITELQNKSLTYPYVPPLVPVFINQTPSDLNVFNTIGVPMTIYYNYTGISTTNATLEYAHLGMNEVINGSLQPVYQNKTYDSISNEIVKYSLNDNQILGYTGNVDEEYLELQPHEYLSTNSVNDIWKIEFLNVTSTKNFNIVEIMVNSTTTSNIYICNSTYSTGNPSVNNNCVLVGVNNGIGFNHTHSNSKHNVFYANVINGFIGSVKLTSTLNVLIRPNSNNVVNLGVINGSVRSNMFSESGNNGATYTANNLKIPDAHLHFGFNGDGVSENLSYRAYSINGYSAYRTDNIGLTLQPPTPPQIKDVNSIYTWNETIRLNWSSAIAQNGSKISYYNISLLTSNYAFVKNYGLNTSNNDLNINVNSTDYGEYIINVRVYDNNSYYSDSYSNLFYIQSLLYSPCNISFTSNSTGSTLLFNWTTQTGYINTTIKGKLNNLITDFTTDTQGDNTFIGFNNGIYYLYFNETYNNINNYEYDSSCRLDVCVSNWVSIPQQCISNLKLVNYTDTNNCPVIYDLPSDSGTYIDCSTPSNTDKELWILIFLFVLWTIILILSFRIPLLCILGFIISSGIIYYMIDYFGQGSGGVLIGVIMIIMNVLISFVGVKFNK